MNINELEERMKNIAQALLQTLCEIKRIKKLRYHLSGAINLLCIDILPPVSKFKFTKDSRSILFLFT